MKCSAQHLTQGQHLVSWLLLFEFPEIIFFIYIFQEIFIPLNHMIIFQFIKKKISSLETMILHQQQTCPVPISWFLNAIIQ